jgi:hypothetical protein
VEQRFQFTMKAGPRRVDAGGVAQLDAALAKATGAAPDRVLHAIDPRRIASFADGGPAVWSVALSPCRDGCYLFVTYGLSRAIDPDARFDHEMSIRVAPDGQHQPPHWPVFFLRQLARYQITSGRELAAGEPMGLGESITRFAMAPAEKAQMPDSPMHAIAVVDDPVLPGARRAYGLLPDEQALAEPWSIAGTVAEIARREPTLTTDVRRGSWSSDPSLVEAVRVGAKRDGSSTGALLVPGLRWEPTADGFRVQLAGGATALRFCALAHGRLPFGRNLLLHDPEPGPYRQIGLVPSDRPFARAHGDQLLEAGMRADSPILRGVQRAANHPSTGIRFTLR